MNKIDTHCHIFPAEYMDEVSRRNLFKTKTKPPIWISIEERLAKMDQFGIDRQVLSLSNPLVYFGDDSLNLFLAQLVNDYIGNICQKYPARFSGFAAIPLENTKDAVNELKRAMKLTGMLGAVIGAHVNGKVLASPEFTPFFEEANRLDTTIFIHPVNPVGIDNIHEYQDFYRSVGFLWETTVAVGRMAMAGVFEKYPNIKWILSHLGGTIPFVYTSFDICQKRNPAKEYMAPKPASEYLRKLYVDTARQISDSIINCALDLYGDKHIIYGSDMPFAYDVAELNVSKFKEISLSDSFKQSIYYGNAKNLFNLD